MMAVEPKGPDNPSGAYDRMREAWSVVDDILAGPSTIRSRKEKYLPKYAAEEGPEYERRLQSAPWQPEFADIIGSLSSKPFGKDVAVMEGASDRVRSLVEDIDGKGNNLTAFARPLFRNAIGKGQHHILVDNTGRGEARTIAEERQAGVRPYWISIRAEDVLALYTATVDGREAPIHVRLRECSVERAAFEEKTVERVRVLNRDPEPAPAGQPQRYGPPTWALFEKTVDAAGGVTWPMIASGALAPMMEIPLATLWTGDREGPQFARPPLDALADKQIELYRALSRQDEILTYSGSPMLCGEGIAAPKVNAPPLQIGPKRVLFAPPGVDGKATTWSYIQPDAANLTEIRESVKALVDDIRRLGMQPQTQKAGVVTAKQSGVEESKAHSVVEAWALALKDVLEQAFVFTSLWLGEEPNVEVEVNTDFSVQPYAQAPLDALSKARAAGDLSRQAYLASLRRFDVLPPDFDAVADEALLEAEGPALGTMQERPSSDPTAGP